MSEKFASSRYTDFTVLEELYRSQAGAVYKAVFKYDKKEYVLKERKLPKSQNPKDIMNEVKLLVQLHHQNVIKCQGWFREESRQSIFIVLEFCGGGDLNTFIQNQRASKQYFEEAQVWGIFHQLCCGLRHLHENGIIHRDLKPLNVMISASGRTFKLGDLGVSRQLSEETLMVRSFYGTPLYLSPELVENKPYNEKTDIWSLGVILYELCCLQPPFQANTLLDMARMVSAGKYAPLPARYSSHMHRCVAWLLQVDYSKRPNIAQVLNFVDARLNKQSAAVPGNAAAVEPSLHSQQQSAPARGDKRREQDQRAGDEGSDTADTADEGSDLEQDSLDEGSAGRGVPQSRRGSAAAAGAQRKKARDVSRDGGAARSAFEDDRPRARHAGTGAGCDDDTASEDEDGRGSSAAPAPSFDRRSRRTSAAAVAHASSAEEVVRRRNTEGVMRRGSLEEVVRAEEVVRRGSAEEMVRRGSAEEVVRRGSAEEVVRKVSAAPDFIGARGDYAAPSLNLPVQPSGGKRQSIQELKQDRRRQERSAPAPPQPPGECVQADPQRLGVLLRREAATLRKLLQLRDFVANNPDAQEQGPASSDAPSVTERVAISKGNIAVLESALDRGGMISLADAARFKLNRGGAVMEEPGVGNGRAPPSVPAAAAQAVPVTKLPHRPGEPAALGMDINADRKGHSRHLVDPAYYLAVPGPGQVPIPRQRPATAGARPAAGTVALVVADDVGRRRRGPHKSGGAGGEGEAKLRKSPERKQVPQGGQELVYDNAARVSVADSDFAARQSRVVRHEPAGDAAGRGIGGDAAVAQALYQPVIAGRQGLFQPEVAPAAPVLQRRPSTAAADEDRGGRSRSKSKSAINSDPVSAARAPSEVPAGEAVVTEYRIFDERSDRRRQGANAVARSVAGKGPIEDENSARKARLREMWESNAGEAGAGCLPLPSMHGQRPHTANHRLSSHAVGADHFEGASLQVAEKPQARRERDLEKYVDIMDACRDIADKHRRPAHRRLKSDITNPGFVLPPPARPSATEAQVVVPVQAVPPPACRPDSSRGQRPEAHGRDRAAQLQLRTGAGSDEEQGAGSDEDGSPAASPLPSPPRAVRGLASREQYRRDRGGVGQAVGEIKLRGAGHHADGEMLPAQCRQHKDSAFRILAGK